MKLRQLFISFLVLCTLLSCDTALKDRMVDMLIVDTPQVTILPGLSDDNGEYLEAQTVTLSCSDADSQIHYELYLNGNLYKSGIYEGPFYWGGPDNRWSLSTYATAEDSIDSYSASLTASLRYDTLDPPYYSLNGDTYSSDQQLEIISASPGSEIWYTTDGNDPRAFVDVLDDSGTPTGQLTIEPSVSALLYSAPITLAGHGTEYPLKAFIYLEGFNPSEISSQYYRISYPQLESPVISVLNEEEILGTFPEDIQVEILPPEDAPQGYQIYYTTQFSVYSGDTDPSVAAQLYEGPIAVTGQDTEMTLFTWGVASQYQQSENAVAPYLIYRKYTEEPQLVQNGSSLQFFAGDGTNEDIIIYITYSTNGIDPLTPVLTGHYDPIALGEDQDSYLILGGLTVYRLRNNSSLDLSALPAGATVELSTRAFDPGLVSAEKGETNADVVSPEVRFNILVN